MRLPSAMPLTLGEQLALTRSAFRDDTATPGQRHRLAKLLFAMDFLDEAVVVLEKVGLSGDFGTLMTWAEVHLARRTRQDDATARDILLCATEKADTPARRARAFAELGRAALHLGDRAGAQALFSQSLRVDPRNGDAFRRLALLALEEGRNGEAMAMAEAMLALNASQTRALAIQAAALAALKQPRAAQAVLGLERFGHRGMLPVPDGWPTIAAFNQALADELMGHPGLRYERYGTAAIASWRIDEPRLVGRSPLFSQLLEAIRGVVEDHALRLEGSDHPFFTSRPATGDLSSWVVITNAAGYEDWHIHPGGWLSGVYYVEVPPRIATANDVAGCLEFGVSPGDADAADNGFVSSHFVRPKPGLFMLFPSCNHHRTHPHNDARRRICVAFDVVPAGGRDHA